MTTGPAPAPTGTARGPRPPARAAGVVLLGPLAGSGYRRPPQLVRRADGQTVQLSPLLHAVLAELDGERGLGEVAAAASERAGRLLEADDVAYLIEHKLAPLGLVRTADGTEPVTRKRHPLLGLRLRVVVTNPRITGRLAAMFAWLFHPAVVVPAVLAFAATSAWALLGRGLGTAVDEALYSPRLMLVLIALTVVSAAFHELGHAAACRYGGARPGAMGAALYLIWPVFYTDVTDSYRLSRAGRLRVDLGGLYFNALFSLGAIGAWAVTGAEPLLLMVPVLLLQMVRQLVPLVRFDGYHILADLVGVPDLFARIRPILASLVPGRRHAAVEPLRPWVRVVVTAWVAAVVPALLVGFGFVLVSLPRVASNAWGSLALQAQAIGANLDAGALDRVALGAVYILTIALLPASMGYLVARVLRRAGNRFWTATEGRPAPRAVVVLAAASVALAGITAQWWPDPQFAPPAAAATGGVPQVAAPIASLDRSAPSGGVVLAAATPEVTTASLADVAVASAKPTTPSTGGTATRRPTQRPAWPFPFDPPAPPRPGDNQALAVNTVDGASRHAASFDLQWLDGGPIRQVNSAWALAECIDCTTVAAAFQALIVTGEPGLTVPQNIAVSLNHACEACRTDAVAVQLVVTLTRPIDPAVRGQVQREFARLAPLRQGIRRMAPSEVRAQLLSVKAAIWDLLAPYAEPLQESGDLAEADDREVDGQGPEAEVHDTGEAGDEPAEGNADLGPTWTWTAGSGDGDGDADGSGEPEAPPADDLAGTDGAVATDPASAPPDEPDEPDGAHEPEEPPVTDPEPTDGDEGAGTPA